MSMADDSTRPHADLERQLTDVVHRQRDLVARLQQDQQYFQRMARSVWRVQEDERRRLSRDLHDGIGQSLTAILRLLSQSIDTLLTAPQDAQASLEKTRAIALQTFADTRALSRLLRPQILDELGLEAALRWLARSVGETHTLDIRVDVQEPPPQLDGERNTLIFRLVQEALTNAARHAQARSVEIILNHDDDRVHLRIRDDGRGCDMAHALAKGAEGHSSGIGGMRDRVRLFNGEFEMQSQPGAGCTIAIAFPLRTSGDGTPA